MLAIGEFSKICGVSTKTLRYYDEIGLIRPVEINTENGYRYYSIEQMKKMLFINRLKTYGFSLDEIKQLTEYDEGQQEEELYKALNLKKLQLKNKLSSINNTLNQLNGDILNLKGGKDIMSYLDNIGLELVETEKVNLLYIRRMFGEAEYAEGYGKYYGELFERIAKDKLTMIGAPLAVYHGTEYDPTGNDTELGIPVKEAVKGTRDFGGGLCVKSTIKGSYDQLTSAYAKIQEWTEKNGYEITAPPYDVYLTDPYKDTNIDEYVTEVYFPVKKK